MAWHLAQPEQQDHLGPWHSLSSKTTLVPLALLRHHHCPSPSVLVVVSPRQLSCPQPTTLLALSRQWSQHSATGEIYNYIIVCMVVRMRPPHTHTHTHTHTHPHTGPSSKCRELRELKVRLCSALIILYMQVN